jgi:SAM-dependent methyltransferase
VAVARIRSRVFGEAAELYERRRPGYPDALYDQLLTLVGAGGRALEAGAGTGRATVELARRGLQVVAVEPDAAMADHLRRSVSGLPVRIEQRPFEEWDGEAGSFELVACAQAWHWLDPERGLAVARRALRPDGVLALWWNQPDSWEGPLRDAIDHVYRRYAPELTGSMVNRPALTDSEALTLDGFEWLQRHRFAWTERYDTAAYVELLQTHSDHRMLPGEQLTTLLDAVAMVIDRAGGELIYPYRTDLFTLRRTAPPYARDG